MAFWCEQFNNLSFGIIQWQDTQAEFPKFSSLPFIVRQKVIILELAPGFLFWRWRAQEWRYTYWNPVKAGQLAHELVLLQHGEVQPVKF